MNDIRRRVGVSREVLTVSLPQRLPSALFFDFSQRDFLPFSLCVIAASRGTRAISCSRDILLKELNKNDIKRKINERKTARKELQKKLLS